MLQGKPVFRLRGNLLPLVSLSDVLGMSTTAVSAMDSEITNIVVLSVERQVFGLIVDEVQDTADIVVKPLSPFLKALSVYSGATVLGDGSVALILDAAGIAHQSRVIPEAGAEVSSFGRETTGADAGEELQEFLLIRLNSQAKHCLPMNLVQRLEEFAPETDRIFRRSARGSLPRFGLAADLVKSGAGLCGIVPAGGRADPRHCPKKGRPSLRHRGRRDFGRARHECLPRHDLHRSGPAILANLVCENEIVVVLDALRVLDDFIARFSGSTGVSKTVFEKATEPANFRILFAEDTVFFRKHIGGVLERAGYQVTFAFNGADALAAVENAVPARLISFSPISRCRRCPGSRSRRAVRKIPAWATIPMIAITTRYDQKYVEEGKRAGFNSYLEKLNPEVLLHELNTLLPKREAGKKAA